MKKTLLILGVIAICTGCNAVRQGVRTVDSALGVIGAVKDDAVGAVNKLIDISENVKTNITTGASATVSTATQ